MIIIKSPDAVFSIPDPNIRTLVQQRFTEICSGQPYDYDQHGYMILVGAGDTVADLELESSCRILHNLFDDIQFDDPEFVPSFEWLLEHESCYEMVYILNDEGFGIDIFIPKNVGIRDLLAMCAEYAEPVGVLP